MTDTASTEAIKNDSSNVFEHDGESSDNSTAERLAERTDRLAVESDDDSPDAESQQWERVDE